MSKLTLFQAYGIEVETMLVNAADLSVFPVCDRVLAAAGDRFEGEVVRGETCWSNELVLHVIERKTNGPRASLDGLAAVLAADVRAINAHLEPLGGRLLPTAMHPWMNPLRDTRLWPHGYGDVYRTYDRAFGCRGHGWSNLQSVHVNLPFSGDREFGRLHAAIRLVLPLLPALAASSPIVEGAVTGMLDTRLAMYRRNQRLVPSITGSVVPERVFTRADYEDRILRPIARDIARLDRDGILDPEWVNSRGAIARFVRDSIEIRVLDAQESSSADVAIAAATIAVVRALVDEKWVSTSAQREWHECLLEPIFTAATERAGNAVVENGDFLGCFGFQDGKVTLRDLWAYLIETLDVTVDGTRAPLDVIVRQGSLSERILRATGPTPHRERLRDVYRALADCLHQDRSFEP
jgi:glutamate---cysteine ligase / carboxylate-amine ligase